MTRSVKAHAGLLLVALIASYFVWTREPSPSDDVIKVLNLGKLDKLVYEEPDHKVVIRRMKDDKGTYFWVKVDRNERKRPKRRRGHPRFRRRMPRRSHPATKVGPAKKRSMSKKAREQLRKALLKRLQQRRGATPKKAAPKTKAAPKKKVAPKKKAAPKSGALTPTRAERLLASASLARDPKADPKKKKAPKGPAKRAPAKKAAKKAPAKKAPARKAGGKNPAAKKGSAAGSATGSGSGSAATPASAPTSQPAKPKKPEIKKVHKVKQFKGNAAAEDVMNKLGEMTAIRSLGTVDAKQLEAFGLKDSKRRLELYAGKTKRVFLIGSKTYGSTDYYVQDQADKRVYVVRPRQLQSLKFAHYRLVDRALFDFAQSDVERVVIKSKKGQRVLVQHNRRARRGGFWAKEGEEKKSEQHHTWMNKLMRLRARDFVQPKDKPASKQRVFVAQFYRGSKKLGVLQLFRATSAKGWQLAGPKSGEVFLAKTDTTRALVRLPKRIADGLAKDIDAIIKD